MSGISRHGSCASERIESVMRRVGMSYEPFPMVHEVSAYRICTKTCDYELLKSRRHYPQMHADRVLRPKFKD